MFRADPNVVVASDLPWYPVEGDPGVRKAPDVMVTFGRPGGSRDSYKQWEEGGIAPQVVFELYPRFPGASEVIRDYRFYDHFAVEEVYFYEVHRADLCGWFRDASGLNSIPEIDGWVSPRLGSRFVRIGGEWMIASEVGTITRLVELAQQREEAVHRAERLAERLRELGIDPDA